MGDHSASSVASTAMRQVVLIVDDEEHLRRGLALALRRIGFRVRTAADGHEALAQLTTPTVPPIDAVLLDLSMPGLDGMSVLRRLVEVGHRPPVIILSAAPSPEDRAWLSQHGFPHLIPKPFVFDDVVHMLDVVFDSHGIA